MRTAGKIFIMSMVVLFAIVIISPLIIPPPKLEIVNHYSANSKPPRNRLCPPAPSFTLTAPTRSRLKSPGTSVPPAALDQRKRIRIEEDIRLHGGDYSILGKINVIQSDIVELDNGEKQRQSIVRSSTNDELVMVIEHFDRSGQFIHSSFHSAERVIASLEDKLARHRLRTALSSIGYSSESEAGWHNLVIVRAIPDPEKIFELKNILENWVGSSGSVFLAGSRPK